MRPSPTTSSASRPSLTGCYDTAMLAEFDALPSLTDALGADVNEDTPAPAHEDCARRGGGLVYGGPTSVFMPVGLARRDADWQIACRALLSCRNIVRAEKTYRAVLLQLLDGEVSVFPARAPPSLLIAPTHTSTPTPPLMRTYLHPSSTRRTRCSRACTTTRARWASRARSSRSLPSSRPPSAPSPTSSPASSAPGTPASTVA
jgi:hypothetical protein